MKLLNQVEEEKKNIQDSLKTDDSMKDIQIPISRAY